MFLVGGPAYSGTTLLAHLLTQDEVICLHEPNIHDPDQNHKAIGYLRQRFPGKAFPEHPGTRLTYEQGLDLFRQCASIASPYRLGFKSCNWIFVEYAKLCRQDGDPVMAIIRDIRDALVSPLPAWMGGEDGLNRRYRLIWNHRELFDLWVRYEDLVMKPDDIMRMISDVLAHDFRVKRRWNLGDVPRAMLWEPRHRLLTDGCISRNRIGLWRNSGRSFSAASHETAAMMGYGP